MTREQFLHAGNRPFQQVCVGFFGFFFKFSLSFGLEKNSQLLPTSYIHSLVVNLGPFSSAGSPIHSLSPRLLFDPVQAFLWCDRFISKIQEVLKLWGCVTGGMCQHIDSFSF